MVPKSKNAKTGFFRQFRSDAIFGSLFLMLTPVNFNNKLLFKANKIEHEIFKWVLPPKFQTDHLPAAQEVP